MENIADEVEDLVVEEDNDDVEEAGEADEEKVRLMLIIANHNSMLATSGEKEIEFSMPALGRNGITGKLVPRLNLPTASKPVLNVAADVKPVVSVGDAFCSDSDDEEIISGIYGKKTLSPLKQKQKKQINRGFLN